MRRYHFNKLFHVIIPTLVAFVVLFAAISPSLAQNATPPATPPVGSSNDDSDQLPIYINITGYVQDLTATTLRINDQTIIIPSGMALPPEIQIGKVASLRGNLRNDDTIIIIIIVPGYHLPTPTPTAVGTHPATPPAPPLPTDPPTPLTTAPQTPHHPTG